MKRFFLCLFGLWVLLSCNTMIYAQAPQGISYQAVARNAGNLVTNSFLQVRFTLAENGSTVYQEEQNIQTNGLGLFSATIGEGTPNIGTFSGIDWTSGEFFLEVELNLGSGFEMMGNSKVQSVPFSLFAEKAASVEMSLNELMDVTAPAPSLGEVLKWNGSQWEGDQDNVEDADNDPNNETQTLSLSGSDLSLSNGGGTVILPTGTTYTAGSGISLAGNSIINTAPDQTVSLTGSGATTVSGAYPNFNINSTDNVNDADSDASNELQNLSLAGFDLSLSNGGGTVSLPAYTGGTGISLSGTTINNLGDIDPSDDITIGSSSGGDLGGTYPNPTVTSLQGQSVSTLSPALNDVLKWNGSEWKPSPDNAGSSVWNTSGSDVYRNSGDVGIGTSSPDAKVEISSNASLTYPQIHLHENGNDYARIKFDNNNGSNYWTIAAYNASNFKNDRLNFWNGATGDILTLTGDGEMGLNVGISPKTTFHVGNQHRVLFGTDTLGSGDKLMFLPDIHAFRVGTLSSGNASNYWNRDSIGEYSFASGWNTRATGFGATAMGVNSEAIGSYSFSIGYLGNSRGAYGFTAGYNTDADGIASFAMGTTSDALGHYSTAFGIGTEAQAYSSTVIGRYNIGLGSATTWNSNDPVFEIGIGTGSSNRANAMTVRKNGNVGIGTTSPGEKLHVAGKIRFAGAETLEDGGANEIASRADLRPITNGTYDLGTSLYRWGAVYATNGVIQTSDRREKRNIQNLEYGLAEILQLRPIRFEWKDRPHDGAKLGLVAQELLPVINEVVQTHTMEEIDGDESELHRVKMDRLGVNYSDLIPVLIKAIQDQQEVIESLEKRLQALEK
ncbi:MAG: tail fiber domain-containing protein [Bacteroidota bacterium]